MFYRISHHLCCPGKISVSFCRVRIYPARANRATLHVARFAYKNDLARILEISNTAEQCHSERSEGSRSALQFLGAFTSMTHYVTLRERFSGRVGDAKI